jgi:hypothetical protein
MGRYQQETPEAPTTEEELRIAVKQGTSNKSSGEDAICCKFYVADWETLNVTFYTFSCAELKDEVWIDNRTVTRMLGITTVISASWV